MSYVVYIYDPDGDLEEGVALGPTTRQATLASEVRAQFPDMKVLILDLHDPDTLADHDYILHLLNPHAT